MEGGVDDPATNSAAAAGHHSREGGETSQSSSDHELSLSLLNNLRENEHTRHSVRSNLVLFEQDGTDRPSLAEYLSRGPWGEQQTNNGAGDGGGQQHPPPPLIPPQIAILPPTLPRNSPSGSIPPSPDIASAEAQDTTTTTPGLLEVGGGGALSPAARRPVSYNHENDDDDDDDEDDDFDILDDANHEAPNSTSFAAATRTSSSAPLPARNRRKSMANPSSSGPLLGTLMGVYIPCCSNIMGVIIFVRLAWIVGQAGVGQAILIAGLATLCTFLTALSMSAIATNGRVAAGGAYYMISRSLGKEFGGSVGILFCLANAVGCVMYILGVVEILTSYIVPGMSLGDPYKNARVYGTCLLFLLAMIVLIGIGIVNKASLLFSAAVVIAILGALIGLLASNRPGMIDGVTGFPGNITGNFPPGYSLPDKAGAIGSTNFFELFGIFFPSVTGIMAGASRSGNLKDPQKSIPMGTIGAQVTTSFIYYIFILLLGTVVGGPLLRTKIPTSGLLVASVAWPTPWVTLIGCIFASLGAGLQCFVSAPRLIQALSKDNIIPFLRPFSTLSRKSSLFGILPAGEPRRALILTIVIAEAVVLVGNLDAVASIVTMLYLITYLFINISTALLGFLQSPNWRPSWKFYHWTVSTFAAVLCLTYMFMISWASSLVSLGIMFGVYKYIEYRGAQVFWGDGLQALNMQIAQRNLIAAERSILNVSKLSSVFSSSASQAPSSAAQQPSIKNWRPQILGFVEVIGLENDDDHTESTTSARVKNPSFLDFLGQLKKAGGLTIVSSILISDIDAASKTNKAARLKEVLNRECRSHRLTAFTNVLVSPSLKYGVLACTQCCGVGVLQPNTVMIGYPESWSVKSDVYACLRFVEIVKSVVSLDKAVVAIKGLKKFPVAGERQYGTIDVYWIMHDGGVMTLLSYLLRKHAVWRNCKLRIFAIAQLKDNSVAMKENLVQSLKFLRIEAEADVLELGDYDISEFAYERTIKLKEREQLLKNVAGSGNILAMPSAASSFSLFGNQQGEGGGGGGAVTGSMPRARKMSVAGVSELMMSRFRAPKTNAAAVAAAVAANGGSNSSESPLLMMASSSSRNSLAGAGRSGSLSDNLTAAVATTNNNINIDTPSQPPTVLPAIPLHILRETRSNPSLNNAVTSSEGGSGSLSNMNTENNNSSQQYDSLNRKVAMMNTSVKLNTLIRANSGGAASKCRLILCNLPAPSKLPHNAPENVRKEHALAYMQYLDCLTEGLERVILVKGTGTEVITTYF